MANDDFAVPEPLMFLEKQVWQNLCNGYPMPSPLSHPHNRR
jgi:hypothetical protein